MNVTTYFAGQVISLLQLMFSFDHNLSLDSGKGFIIVGIIVVGRDEF